MKCLYVLFLFYYLNGLTQGLQCYVCTNQEENDKKCGSNVQICEYEEDRCLSEVKWKSTPYWSAKADKQYYITKRCANQSMCETLSIQYIKSCHHIWYEDWTCVECCQGDLCNYYITLSGSINSISLSLVLSVIILWCFYNTIQLL